MTVRKHCEISHCQFRQSSISSFDWLLIWLRFDASTRNEMSGFQSFLHDCVSGPRIIPVRCRDPEADECPGHVQTFGSHKRSPWSCHVCFLPRFDSGRAGGEGVPASLAVRTHSTVRSSTRYGISYKGISRPLMVMECLDRSCTTPYSHSDSVDRKVPTDLSLYLTW